MADSAAPSQIVQELQKSPLQVLSAPVTPETALQQIHQILNVMELEKLDFEDTQVPELTDDQQKIKQKYKKVQEQVKGGEIHKILSKINKLSDEKSIIEEYVSAKQSLEQQKIEREKANKDREKLNKQKNILEAVYKDLVNKYNIECDINKELISKQKDKRQKLADSFQDRIQVIQTTLESQGNQRFERQKTHEEYKHKIQELDHRINTKELIFNTELQKKDLQFKIQETTLKHELQVIEDHAGKASSFEEDIQQRRETDSQLQVLVKGYSEKSDEFQSLISDSNKDFGFFQNEMERNSLKLKETELINSELKQKLEKSNAVIFSSAEEDLALKNELNTQKQQLNGLQSLLKQLEDKLQQKAAQ